MKYLSRYMDKEIPDHPRTQQPTEPTKPTPNQLATNPPAPNSGIPDPDRTYRTDETTKREVDPEFRLDHARGILAYLAMRGVGIRLENDRPMLKGAKGVLTPEDHEVLAEYRAELIELLKPEFPPMPWRAELPNLPLELRDRWGYRANALEDEGMHWRDAEEQAFREITSSRLENAA